MVPALRRPKLRPVEAIFVQDAERGPVIVLRDTEGIAPGAVLVPAEWSEVLARFNGMRSVEEIARDASRAGSPRVTAAMVAGLAGELDRAFMLESPSFWARRREVVQAFVDAPVREAAHAGGSYPGDRAGLVDFIESRCFAEAERAAAGTTPVEARLFGLCAPHMDLWRAAAGYGRAYGALARALSSPAGASVDTFVLLGTSHAAMRRPYAVCDKAFATPLGELLPDRAFIAELAEQSRFDIREEQHLHKTEHSLEFQVIFLQHLLGGCPATIVPVLCGVPSLRDPAGDDLAESFLCALRAAIARRDGRAMVIAGADLAHVGPRFGDAAPLGGSGRDALRRRDHESIARATELDALGFFAHVASDLATRRVCGLGPIYTLLRAMPAHARGELLD
ncbi:MAG TPA: AmmeMemoRadiSam system protein B, partial [Candidatus Nanopelagicales bacterium]|nr:AmmeMemoRadiSam system protein B [Candidatus Nanopelagicales bacterium]